jgi:hypothetical protein
MKKLYQAKTKEGQNPVVLVHRRKKAESFQIKDVRLLKEVRVVAENLHLQTQWVTLRGKSVTVIRRIPKSDKFIRFVINYTICWQMKRKLFGNLCHQLYLSFCKKLSSPKMSTLISSNF